MKNVPTYNEFLDEGNTDFKFSSEEMKSAISDVYDKISFRKFGNAFRKHIDKFFSKGSNQEALRGMSWGELSSYIIGDGDYSVNETQFRNFMKAVGEKLDK